VAEGRGVGESGASPGPPEPGARRETRFTQRLGMDSQSAVTSEAFALLPKLHRER